MSSLPKHLLLALGLDPTEVEAIGGAEPPRGPAGHGLASGATTSLSEVVRSPWFSEAALDVGVFGGAVRHWDHDPRVVAVDVPLVVRTSSGGVTFDAALGRLILDARAGGCAARVDTFEGEFALTNEGGRLSLGRVRTEAAMLDHLSTLTITEDPVIDVPSPRQLLGPLACASWLQEDATRLADSPRWGDRVAVLGLLARTWSPVDAGTRRAFATGDLVVPEVRARDWAQRAERTALDRIERVGLLDADDWESALDLTVASLIAVPNDGEQATLDLLLHRDDLESLAWVVEAAGRGAVLRARLDNLDERGRAQMSALRAAQGAIATSERLAALSWQASELWWGQLG